MHATLLWAGVILIALGTWPEGWDGNEPTADTPLDTIYRDGSVQPLMV